MANNFASIVKNLNSFIYYFNTACIGYKIRPPYKGKHFQRSCDLRGDSVTTI